MRTPRASLHRLVPILFTAVLAGCESGGAVGPAAVDLNPARTQQLRVALDDLFERVLPHVDAVEGIPLSASLRELSAGLADGEPAAVAASLSRVDAALAVLEAGVPEDPDLAVIRLLLVESRLLLTGIEP
jgi:hypothetical protein